MALRPNTAEHYLCIVLVKYYFKHKKMKYFETYIHLKFIGAMYIL